MIKLRKKFFFRVIDPEKLMGKTSEKPLPLYDPKLPDTMLIRVSETHSESGAVFSLIRFMLIKRSDYMVFLKLKRRFSGKDPLKGEYESIIFIENYPI